MDQADPTERRARLAELAHALRSLHKRLIASVQVGWEKLHGRVAGPGALLQLLLHDPLFAWLRPLSTLIAELDERLDEPEPLEARALGDLRAGVELLLAGDGEFAACYREVLQHDADVVMEHSALRKLLTAPRR
jgi:hypothetical protein